MTNGLIKDCKAAGCGFHCCGFGSDGHIIVMKSEEAEVLKSTNLIQTGDESNGSMKVKCVAKNKASCDEGYKPIQCRSYPLYKRGDKWERSERCPLSDQQAVGHLSSVVTIFSKEDADFLRSQKTTMYRRLTNVYERTFGLEVEFGDVKKSAVKLPSGWKWSKEEKSIVNSNGKKSTPTGERGGELNTAPLSMRLSDLRVLRNVIKGCFDAGGVMMWNTGFDGHLWVGDVGLDGLKRIFALGFYVSPLINEVFRLGEWFGVEHLVPTPTFEFNERVQRAESIESFRNIFANSSNRGHYRFQVNVMSYFTTETVEFRIFNSTRNFRETLETIRFMYKFVDFALTADEAEFRRIKTVDDFKRVFGIVREMPKSHAPLIFAASVKNAASNISKGFRVGAKEKQVILDITNKDKKLYLVNPFNYDMELSFFGKRDIVIVNNSVYHDLVRVIANGGVVIYKDEFEWLNSFRTGETWVELVLFFVFKKTHSLVTRKIKGREEYSEGYLLSIYNGMQESLIKMGAYCRRLVEMFASVEVSNDVSIIADTGGMDVVYQQFYDDLLTVSAVKKKADFSGELIKTVDVDFTKASKDLIVISENEYLDMRCVYANKKEVSTFVYAGESREVKGLKCDTKEGIYEYKLPSDNYEVKSVKIVPVGQRLFSDMRAKFIKKVTTGSKRARPIASYAVLGEDNVVLGAFGFEYVDDDEMGEYSIVLSSDFCTNNNVPLLSKLILFSIKSVELKKMLERKLTEKVTNGYTVVYTTMPVSMKYRGAFSKIKAEGSKLYYSFEFGAVGTLSDAVNEYKKRVGKIASKK